jgi:hypothetical protein
MRFSVLAFAVLASAVAARNSRRGTCKPKPPTTGPGAPEQCDLSGMVPTLSADQTQLVLPAGQHTVRIVLGVGVQNCESELAALDPSPG